MYLWIEMPKTTCYNPLSETKSPFFFLDKKSPFVTL